MHGALLGDWSTSVNLNPVWIKCVSKKAEKTEIHFSLYTSVNTCQAHATQAWGAGSRFAHTYKCFDERKAIKNVQMLRGGRLADNAPIQDVADDHAREACLPVEIEGGHPEARDAV